MSTTSAVMNAMMAMPFDRRRSEDTGPVPSGGYAVRKAGA
jgi:hypothetical protein